MLFRSHNINEEVAKCEEGTEKEGANGALKKGGEA